MIADHAAINGFDFRRYLRIIGTHGAAHDGVEDKV